MDFMGEINNTVAAAKELPGLGELAAKVEAAIKKLSEVALHLGTTAMSPKVMDAFAFAHPFLDATGDVVMAWMHLWRATVATPLLTDSKKKKDAAFYEGQVKTADFFINTVLYQTMGAMDAIQATCAAAIEIPDDGFGGL